MKVHDVDGRVFGAQRANLDPQSLRVRHEVSLEDKKNLVSNYVNAPFKSHAYILIFVGLIQVVAEAVEVWRDPVDGGVDHVQVAHAQCARVVGAREEGAGQLAQVVVRVVAASEI